ncbi:MAG: alcohol dehydrogenase catalytic domain-containing protein [Candidatus Saccharicenans sp.]|jgi:L-iditol 2-dehydrogenase|nr:alcohol dehydrogenase catalytic domain-containing protein [Candidatus Saccharicenans sp.]
MKAVLLVGPRQAQLQEKPEPELPDQHWVLLRTRVAGICGSDLHYFVSESVGGEKVPYPCLVGHECSAEVVRVGSEVREVQPGDRVAVEPSISCGVCDQCLVGRFHTCRKIKFLGHPGELDGCLAEYFVMPARNLIKLPPAITLEEAMLAEPLSIALHALNLAGVETTDRVAVLGTGPIGLGLIMLLKHRGLSQIFATDRSEARVRAALQAGANWAASVDQEDIVQEILSRQPLGLEVVFEVSGDQEALDQSVALVRPGGRIIQVGIPIPERVSYQIARLRRKEITIRHSRRQNRCLEPALELIKNKKIEVSWLLSHRFRLEEAQLAFTTAADRLDGVLKAAFVL